MFVSCEGGWEGGRGWQQQADGHADGQPCAGGAGLRGRVLRGVCLGWDGRGRAGSCGVVKDSAERREQVCLSVRERGRGRRAETGLSCKHARGYVCAHMRGSTRLTKHAQRCCVCCSQVSFAFSALPSTWQELLGFSCVRPLRTVAAFLEEYGAGALLDDPLLELATAGAALWFLRTSCLLNLRADWSFFVAAQLYKTGLSHLGSGGFVVRSGLSCRATCGV